MKAMRFRERRADGEPIVVGWLGDVPDPPPLTYRLSIPAPVTMAAVGGAPVQVVDLRLAEVRRTDTGTGPDPFGGGIALYEEVHDGEV